MGEYADEALDHFWQTRRVFDDYHISYPERRLPRTPAPEYYRVDAHGEPIVTCAKCACRARLATGREVYGRNRDVENKLFWVCPGCGDRVGCHPGTNEPLGYLADAETRALRSRVHAAFDPLWKNQFFTRAEAYRWLQEYAGINAAECHMGMMDKHQLQHVLDTIYKHFPDRKPNLANIANFKF